MSATDKAAAEPRGPVERDAMRSMDIRIKNVTNTTWTLKSAECTHGEFHHMGDVNWSPPQTIEPMSVGHFQAESDGTATGTEGYVTYTSSAGDMSIHFDDPFVGSNEYSCRPPSGYDETHGSISGNSASITSTITPSF